MKPRFTLFAVFLFAFSAAGAVPQAERDALIALYDATSGPSWQQRDEWGAAPGTECGWFGVTCDGDHVVELILRFNRLTGPLPAAIAQLPLEVLDLRGNELSGGLPALHPAIRIIELDFNGLTGAVPNFASYPNLDTVNLSYNHFSGAIPSLSGPALRHVAMFGNQLSGAIPVIAGPLITEIDLGRNDLTGAFPSVSGAPALEYLRLTGNGLTGEVPALNAPKLKELAASENAISGTFPSLAGLPDLESLNLAYNDIAGTLPQTAPPRLKHLTIIDNAITGAIPAWSSQLVRMELGGNAFTGPFPAVGAELETLAIGRNQLSGPVPAELPAGLLDFSINDNNFSGALPPIHLPHVTSFSVSRNELSGPLPALDLPEAVELYLTSNDFTGQLPDLAAFPHLERFVAVDNHFSGPIPPFPADTKLSTYEVGGNALTGEIPPSIVNMADAAQVNVSLNGLTTSSPAVDAFLRQFRPTWRSEQLAAPAPVAVVQIGENAARAQFGTTSPSFLAGRVEIEVKRGGQVTALESPLASTAELLTALEPGVAYSLRARRVSEPTDVNRNTITTEWAETVFTLRSEVPSARRGDARMRQLWVDPAAGDDHADGLTSTSAIRTLNEVAARALSFNPGEGLEVLLKAGEYNLATTPVVIRYTGGSHDRPLVIRAAPGAANQVFFFGGNLEINGRSVFFDATGLYMEFSDEILTIAGSEDVVITGGVIQGIRVENSVNVTVQNGNYGHIFVSEASWISLRDSRVGYGAADCLRAFRAAHVRIERNYFNPCMGIFLGADINDVRASNSPYLHYNVSGLKFVNNTVKGLTGGFKIEGAYDSLIAHNTFDDNDGSALVEIGLGTVRCQSGCAPILAEGGWAPTGGNFVKIPNRNVMILNNVFTNTTPAGTRPALFRVPAPVTDAAQTAAGIPVPTRADDGLVIAGNLIWDGPSTATVPGVTGGGCVDHPTCGAAVIRSANTFATAPPQFVNVAGGDYHPASAGNLFGLAGAVMVPFTWADRPAMPLMPKGDADNTVSRDADGFLRRVFVPGAFSTPEAPQRSRGTRR